MVTRRRLVVALLGALALVAALAPLAVVLGAGRLLITVGLVVGAWTTVGRAGVPDLGVALPVALGALAGGVMPGRLGLPVAAGAVIGAVAGLVAGAVSAAVLTRTGRLRGALATLVLTAAAPVVATAWPGVGGEAGFHAVPLVTGSDRLDLVVVGALLAGAGLAAAAVARSRAGARAAVALAAPHVAEASGSPAWRDALPLGAAGGAVLGLVGWATAVLGGSVLPAAFGLPLAGLAVIGAVAAGRSAWAAAGVGLLLALPGVVWPLAPIVGDAPPLLTTGVLALALVLWRGPVGHGARSPTAPLPPPVATDGLRVDVRDLPLPHGGVVALAVAPGEVVRLRGPNGAGKSTLLAAIAGQLPDRGRVALDGAPAPRGAAARARAGVVRTWQRAPRAHPDDLRRAAGLAGGDADAGRAQIAAALAARPRLLLLDEPSAFVPVDELVQLLAAAREAGVTVLVVEHAGIVGVDRTVDVAPAGEVVS